MFKNIFYKNTLFSFSLFFFGLFIFLAMPESVYAKACNVMRLTHTGAPPPSQNTQYTLTLNECNIPFGNRMTLLIRPEGSTGEVYRQIVMDSSSPQPKTFTFSNFLTQEDINRFGQVQRYDVFIEEHNLLNTLIDTQQPNASEIFMVFTGNVMCGAVVTDENAAQCPANCPAVSQNNGTAICTPTPTSIPPEACSGLTFTPIKQGGVWNIAWTLNNPQGLQNQNFQYEAVVIREDQPVLQRNLYCGPVETDDIALGFAQGGCNFSGLTDGERVSVVIERSCGLTGNCPYVCTSGAQNLSSTLPTAAPSTTIMPPVFVTPVPPGGGSGSDGPEGTPQDGQIQPCTVGTSEGVETAFGCIPSDPGALFSLILKISIGFAGGIAFLLIILGGLRILTSTGNPEAMNEGREIVTSAITGLLLIIFSIFLLQFIGVDVLCIPGFNECR